MKRWTGALTGHNTDKVYASQSNPVCAVRIRNIWMNASPHHFHPRVLVKYGLISWCLAETIFMIYIWHHWSHKLWVVMSENCIIRMIAIDTSQCHVFHLQGRRVQSAFFFFAGTFGSKQSLLNAASHEAIHAFPQWSDHPALARCECPQHRREAKSLNGAFGVLDIRPSRMWPRHHTWLDVF